MSKTLSDVKLIDLMPQSLRNDDKIIAACSAIQPELAELNKLLEYAPLYSNIDALPESVLMMLAAEHGVYGPEWFIAKTIDRKRELVKNSFMLNKLRGTRWAVDRIFEILGFKAELKEWFEEGADPYTFRVSFLDITGNGINEEETKYLTALLDTYKPVSRHLKSINMVSDTPPTVSYNHVGVFFKIKGDFS